MNQTTIIQRNNAYETLDDQLGYTMIRESLLYMGVEIAMYAWDIQAQQKVTGYPGIDKETEQHLMEHNS